MGTESALFLKYNSRTVGNRITDERKALHMNQDKFIEKYGEKLGIKTRRTLSKFEQGDENTNFTVWQLLEFCKIFQCETGYLLGEYDRHSRKATDICEETGLSEDAVRVLHNILRGDDNIAECVSILNEFLSDDLIYFRLMDVKDLKKKIVDVSAHIDEVTAKLDRAVGQGNLSAASDISREFWEEHNARSLKHFARDIVDDFDAYIDTLCEIKKTISRCEKLETRCFKTFSMV